MCVVGINAIRDLLECVEVTEVRSETQGQAQGQGKGQGEGQGQGEAYKK